MKFYKYHGTGNDFILIDNRQKKIQLNAPEIKTLCHRHFGIGADGLMLLEESNKADFHMVYFNSDGHESTMCGNGGRCIAAFAKHLGIVDTRCSFTAIDGLHTATIEDHIVTLKMNNVTDIKQFETYTQLNTGSPHYVHFSKNIESFDIKKEGQLIRYSPLFKEEGINVNFVEKISDNEIFVRTYERGVEDETLSCGTGVTACAIAFKLHEIKKHTVRIKTLGGNLEVLFQVHDKQNISEIYLKAEVARIFEGEIEL
ncbi:MAG: diaminopimelate epimerase [Chitinophagaceae bacterium]